MDNSMSNLVKVCDSRHIMGETNKAIRVRIGQTLYGEPITTFLPKSICQVIYRDNGSFDVYIPSWATRNRTCFIGEFKIDIQPGFSPLI